MSHIYFSIQVFLMDKLSNDTFISSGNPIPYTLSPKLSLNP